MFIANGINLPLFLWYGCLPAIILTLFVVGVETIVLVAVAKARARASALLMLKANVLSTVVGAIVYFFRPAILYGAGVRTMADYATTYFFGACVIIIVYFGMSVLVEGFYLRRKGRRESLGLSKRALWLAVVAMNMISYAFVAPVYYWGSKPTFSGLVYNEHPSDVSACIDRIYYVDGPGNHLFRITADGKRPERILDGPVHEFLVSEDETAFVYSDHVGQIWYYHTETQTPALIAEPDGTFRMRLADLSKCKRRFAYIEGQRIVVRSTVDGSLLAEEVLTRVKVSSNTDWGVAWDSMEDDMLHLVTYNEFLTYRIEKGGGIQVEMADAVLAGNYRAWPMSYEGSKGEPALPLPGWDRQGDLVMWSGTGDRGYHIGIWRSVPYGESVLQIDKDYGIMGLGMGANPIAARFLSVPGIVVFEDNAKSIYILNVPKRQFGKLTDGHSFTAAIHNFQPAIPTGSLVKTEDAGKP